jgi:hypothetical protein
MSSVLIRGHLWTPTYIYLNKDSSICVGMRVDGPGGTLPAHVAGEGHPHPPPGRFSE